MKQPKSQQEVFLELWKLEGVSLNRTKKVLCSALVLTKFASSAEKTKSNDKSLRISFRDKVSKQKSCFFFSRILKLYVRIYL